jgi:hypothetical protein
LGGGGELAGVTQPAFPEGVSSRWVETIFSGALVPVIPLPQNQFETFGKNLRSRAADGKIRRKLDGNQSPSGAFVNHFEVSEKGNGNSLSVAERGFVFSFPGEGF